MLVNICPLLHRDPCAILRTSSLLPVCGVRCQLLAAAPGPCQPACLLRCSLPWRWWTLISLALWAFNKPFLLEVSLVMVFYQSKNKVTNIFVYIFFLIFPEISHLKSKTLHPWSPPVPDKPDHLNLWPDFLCPLFLSGVKLVISEGHTRSYRGKHCSAVDFKTPDAGYESPGAVWQVGLFNWKIFYISIRLPYFPLGVLYQRVFSPRKKNVMSAFFFYCLH